MFPEAKVEGIHHISCVILSFLLVIVACEKDRPAQREIATRGGPAIHAEEDKGREGLDRQPKTDNWPMFMHDISYLGTSSDKILRPPLVPVWKFKTGGPVNSSPVVVDGTLYVGSDDHRIYALHARKWGVKWEFEADDRIIYSPTVHGDAVFFSARDNKVYALDAANGKKMWEFQADGWINAPVVAYQQKIYVGCYDNKIYVLDANTGRRKSQERSSVEVGNIRYICSQGEFYPPDARGRARRWRQTLQLSESWPAKANDVVYIGARDSRLRAFDSTTRKEIWQFKTDGWVDSSPAIAKGMLYVGSRDGYVYAFANAGDRSAQEAGLVAGEEGVVTRDRARVYNSLDDKAEMIAILNEGRPLQIRDHKQEGWYGVELPDQRHGWMSRSDFIQVRWSEGLQVNASLVTDVDRMALPRKAEKPSVSPDGSTLVFFDNISAQSLYWKARSIWLASENGTNPTWMADGAFFNARISWSGNGRWFILENLAGAVRQVWMVRSNGTGLRKIANGEAPALSPSGDRVAFIRRDKVRTAIWVHEQKDGTERKLAEIPIQGEEIYAAYGYIADLDLPAWSPDGSRLAVGLDGYHYSDNYARLALVSGSGGVMREMAVRARRLRDVAWSPGGSHLAYVTQEHLGKRAASRLGKQVHLTNLDAKGTGAVFENCEGLAWSPDGKHLAFIEENDCTGMRRKVWLLDANSLQLTQLLASREDIHGVFWLADGRISLIAAHDPSETAPRTSGWTVSVAPLPK